MNIVKRDGRQEQFNTDKIINAIGKAFKEVDGEFNEWAKEKAENIANFIKEKSESDNKSFTIEEIQDMVEDGLMRTKRRDVAKAYITYRYDRDRVRGNSTDREIEEYLNGESEYWNKENSNKNAILVTTQRDYLAGIASKDYTDRKLLPKKIVDAMNEGIIWFHDKDYFAQRALTNCELLNLEDMLQNGTVLNGVMIEKPHKFSTACNIATQIILGVTSSTYGGCTITLTHLAPFVRDSYNKFYNKYIENGMDEEQAEKFANIDKLKDIEDGVQIFNYQVNSQTNINGQAPFLTVAMYLNETEEYREELALIIEEFLKQRILGFKNRKGVYVSPAFPKLIYVTQENNIKPETEYWYLTELAAKCTASRMVPDYISEKKAKELKKDANGNGYVVIPMGCRSLLSPWLDENGKAKFYGRMNMGVVTINLPDIALSSDGNFDKFWEIFEERTELCHEALLLRYKRISSITSDVAPILWRDGGFARLQPGESVNKLLKGGYATISLGYCGIYETTKFMTGESHSSGKGKEFGLEVMRALNRKVEQWKKEDDLGYALYGTPMESTTYKFAESLRRRFGIIKDITDKHWVVNSYHIDPREKIDAFNKLKIESEFQALSLGGAVSYVEVPNMENNIDAVLQLIQFMYDNIMYAEINIKNDYCLECDYHGEMELLGEAPDLYWQCPNCGNKDEKSLFVFRRTCGYCGVNFWNKGRTEEIHDRVLHLE